MDGQLQMLVVGGGSAGVRHFDYLSKMGVQCSVCDPVDDCRVLRDFSDAEHFRDYEKIDLSRFDGVIICTQPTLHVPQALMAARAGCHLLIEKPLSALSEDGIDELQQLVSEKDLVASVAFPYANMKAMDRIIELVRAEEIGQVQSVAVHIGQNLLKYRPDYYQLYYTKDEAGAGCLQDGTVHPLMGLEMLLGPEREVLCQRHQLRAGSENVTSDDTAWLWLRYDNDLPVTIDYSFQCNWEHNEWVIGGSLAGIKLHVIAAKLEICDAKTGQVRIEQFDDDWNCTFRQHDEDFVAAIREGTPVRCSIEMARVNLRTILAARKSAQTCRPVQIDDMFEAISGDGSDTERLFARACVPVADDCGTTSPHKHSKKPHHPPPTPPRRAEPDQ